MPVDPLFTIGYQGAVLAQFTACLRDACVSSVVDVREMPLSRKKGFSKAALAEALREAGIGYVHMRSLGCPRDIRLRYRSDGSWAAYSRDFLAHLAAQSDSVDALAALAGERTCCVMCFEADFTACHRTYVARAVHRNGGPPVIHLRIGASPVADPEPRNAT